MMGKAYRIPNTGIETNLKLGLSEKYDTHQMQEGQRRI